MDHMTLSVGGGRGSLSRRVQEGVLQPQVTGLEGSSGCTTDGLSTGGARERERGGGVG